MLTFEHGGTPIGKLVRAILADPANSEMTDKTEALLIAADRAQHIERGRSPGARRPAGTWSATAASTRRSPTRATGGACRSTRCGRVNEWAIDGRWPDLVVLLDVPAEQLAHRMRRRELDRFERAGAEFHAPGRGGLPPAWPPPTPSAGS